MTRRSPSLQKPHARKKAAQRELSPDEEWANEIRERVLADCHPFQRPAVETRHRFISMLCGRGGGKTTTMRARALIRGTRTRKGRFIYFAPTRTMAKELNWEPLKSMIEHYGLMDDFTFSESELRAVCTRTGSFYKLVGMDDQTEVDKHRGQPFDEVQPDEAALYKPELLENLLDKSIGPRLGERNGTMLLASSPGHILRGPFYEYTRPGSTVEDPDTGEVVPLHVPFGELEKYPGWDSYVSFCWTARDVYDLPDAQQLYGAVYNNWVEALKVKKRKRWSDQNPIWLREYLAQWAADETGMVFQYRPHLEDGTPWNQWDPFNGAKLEGVQALRLAIGKLRELHPDFQDWRYVYAADKGSTDPFALNVFTFSPRDPDRNIWHVMPFERVKMYIRQWAEMFIGAELKPEAPAKDSIIGITNWPDGAVMDSDQTTIDELANVYGVRFEKADRNPFSKTGAIELTNGDLIDGRIKIIKGSVLEQQLQTLQWAEDTHGRVIENKAQANHSTDTLLYGRKKIANLFESGVVVQEDTKRQAVTGYHDPMGLDPGIGTVEQVESEESLLAPSEWAEDAEEW